MAEKSLQDLMNLDDAAALKIQDTAASEIDAFLSTETQFPNVVGMGVGVKWSGGKPTGKPALLALVTQKIDPDDLPSDSVVPKEIAGVQTDVLAIGTPFAQQEQPIEAGIQALARRARPASGGYSVGHVDITAGTMGTCVIDRLGTSGNPIGVPKNYYILSNNHVLANSNNARLGDPILQPGPTDGGVDPSDRIATLSNFVPITFQPPVPLKDHRNLVDAAIAEGEFHDLKREIYWIGHLRGWLNRHQVTVGMAVRKTGRTTNYTTGRITAVNATVDVNYGGGRVARFRDQIITTPLSAGGDSGSVVVDMDEFAVGLLFAGSTSVTILNHIQYVRRLLNIDFL